MTKDEIVDRAKCWQESSIGQAANPNTREVVSDLLDLINRMCLTLNDFVIFQGRGWKPHDGRERPKVLGVNELIEAILDDGTYTYGFTGSLPWVKGQQDWWVRLYRDLNKKEAA